MIAYWKLTSPTPIPHPPSPSPLSRNLPSPATFLRAWSQVLFRDDLCDTLIRPASFPPSFQPSFQPSFPPTSISSSNPHLPPFASLLTPSSSLYPFPTPSSVSFTIFHLWSVTPHFLLYLLILFIFILFLHLFTLPAYSYFIHTRLKGSLIRACHQQLTPHYTLELYLRSWVKPPTSAILIKTLH